MLELTSRLQHKRRIVANGECRWPSLRMETVFKYMPPIVEVTSQHCTTNVSQLPGI